MDYKRSSLRCAINLLITQICLIGKCYLDLWSKLLKTHGLNRATSHEEVRHIFQRRKNLKRFFDEFQFSFNHFSYQRHKFSWEEVFLVDLRRLTFLNQLNERGILLFLYGCRRIFDPQSTRVSLMVNIFFTLCIFLSLIWSRITQLLLL